MRGNRRLWVAATVAGVLVALGVLAVNPVSLIAGIGLGLWLLTQQIAFHRATGTVTDVDRSVASARSRLGVDEPTVVHLQVDAPKALPFDLRVSPHLSPGLTKRIPDPVVTLGSGDRDERAEFVVRGAVAERATVGPLAVAFRDAGGFFADEIQWGDAVTIDVQPYASQSLHVGAGGEPLITLYGEHGTDRAGSGLEPYEVREYAPGDNLSRIDWKATARLGHPHVREYEQMAVNETALVVDHRATMGRGIQARTKLDSLREVALSYVGSAERFNDPLGLYTVGDDGVTTGRPPAASVQQYSDARRVIRGLVPTTPKTKSTESDRSNTFSPGRARELAARLDGTPLEATLGPYFESRDGYVRRLDARPLFRTVKLARSRLRANSWTVILTDDTDRTEVYEATKLARRNGGKVLVFLTPSTVYEPGALDRLDEAYREYRDFEEFRQSLARMDRVSAFEVAPTDRLEAVLRRRIRTDDVRYRRPGTTRTTTARPLSRDEPEPKATASDLRRVRQLTREDTDDE
ncbi:DUF58 domain-containing protein [Salinigranum sp. GCM10025319]|uniref:DUF58 domain-containing protein n=1 Tax=Salinigranum sp. GCM10025319 TaxID=3252687 RepID=UPI003619B832